MKEVCEYILFCELVLLSDLPAAWILVTKSGNVQHSLSLEPDWGVAAKPFQHQESRALCRQEPRPVYWQESRTFCRQRSRPVCRQGSWPNCWQDPQPTCRQGSRSIGLQESAIVKTASRKGLYQPIYFPLLKCLKISPDVHFCNEWFWNVNWIGLEMISVIVVESLPRSGRGADSQADLIEIRSIFWRDGITRRAARSHETDMCYNQTFAVRWNVNFRWNISFILCTKYKKNLEPEIFFVVYAAFRSKVGRLEHVYVECPFRVLQTTLTRSNYVKVYNKVGCHSVLEQFFSIIIYQLNYITGTW